MSTFATKTSARVRPMPSSSQSSSFPAWPTNGTPCWSSWNRRLSHEHEIGVGAAGAKDDLGSPGRARTSCTRPSAPRTPGAPLRSTVSIGGQSAVPRMRHSSAPGSTSPRRGTYIHARPPTRAAADDDPRGLLPADPSSSPIPSESASAETARSTAPTATTTRPRASDPSSFRGGWYSGCAGLVAATAGAAAAAAAGGAAEGAETPAFTPAPCTANVELLEDVRATARRARDRLLARADELLEVRLALHARVLVDRHAASVLSRAVERWAVPSSRAGSSGSSPFPGARRGTVARDPRTWRWLSVLPAGESRGLEHMVGSGSRRCHSGHRASARDDARRRDRRLDPLPRAPAGARVRRDRVDMAPPVRMGHRHERRREAPPARMHSRSGAAGGSDSRPTPSTNGHAGRSRRSGRPSNSPRTRAGRGEPRQRVVQRHRRRWPAVRAQLETRLASEADPATLPLPVSATRNWSDDQAIEVIGAGGRVRSAVSARLGERGLAWTGSTPARAALCSRPVDRRRGADDPRRPLGGAREWRGPARRSPRTRRFGMHPLQSFTKARGPEQLDGAWAAVTAEGPDALGVATWLAETLGLRPFASSTTRDVRPITPGRRSRRTTS